jgi:hypothetical protein
VLVENDLGNLEGESEREGLEGWLRKRTDKRKYLHT